MTEPQQQPEASPRAASAATDRRAPAEQTEQHYQDALVTLDDLVASARDLLTRWSETNVFSLLCLQVWDEHNLRTGLRMRAGEQLVVAAIRIAQTEVDPQ